MRITMRNAVLGTVVFGLLSSPALALAAPVVALAGEGGPVDEDRIKTVRLVVPPAAEPRPALRYRLSPHPLDRKTGNAAVLYNKLALHLATSKQPQPLDILSEWLEMPLAEFPLEKAKATLSHNRHVLESVRMAVRRKECDWQLPLTEQNPWEILLPELGKMRTVARLVAVEARVQIVEGKLDEAIRTLAVGYTLGRHVAEAPLLVSALVGAAITQTMSEQLETLLEQPEAPNLYWALTSLPRPLIDLSPAVETEGINLLLVQPEFRRLDDIPPTPEAWRSLLDRVFADFERFFGHTPPKAGWRPLVATWAIAGYPKAKNDLIEEGFSADRVEAMPVVEVLTRHTLSVYNDTRDHLFKWFRVPYWQARAGFKEADQYLRGEGRNREMIPLASMLLPAVSRVALAGARNDRRIALLRTIEALRMHAAQHGGRLPDKLADVTGVPLPIDPMTGKPFVYKLDGKTAVLEAPAPEGESPSQFGKRYEIQIAP